eukprot:10797-Heterococcus_DN1.PRE.1
MWWLKPAAVAIALPCCSAFVPATGGSAAKHHSQASRHARLDDSSVDSVSEGLGKGMQVCFIILACTAMAINAIAARACLQYMYKLFRSQRIAAVRLLQHSVCQHPSINTSAIVY